jgi:glycerol uptake facilitator-like aquaporin
VDGLAGEREFLSASLLVDVGGCAVVDSTLAREVGSITLQRTVVNLSVGLGVGHEHVSTGKGSQAGKSESLREHFE